MIVRRPLHKLELTHEYRLEPTTFGHFRFRQSLPPTAASSLRQIRERSAQEIKANLRAIIDETEYAIPLNLFATYLAGAQISIMQWWLEKRRSRTPDDLTRMLYHMQRAAIRDAFGLHGPRKD